MLIKVIFIFYLLTKMTYGSRNSIEERSSDPLSFNQELVPPIPIGMTHNLSSDVVGRPLTEQEFMYPPMIVDPPMMDGETPKADPIERAGLYEGDIIVNSVEQFLTLTDKKKAGTVGSFRNALRNAEELWDFGVIPYEISSSFNPYERGSIAFAMKEFHDSTCIRFKPRETQKDYIHLIKADGCASSVGKVGGTQVVSLGEGCLTKGVVLHELMHSLGFWHEQARPDRDKHITIIWKNIKKGLEYNFGKYEWSTVQNLSVKYDLGSIMHYGPFAFAKDRTKPTIIANNREEIGQRYGLSERDIEKINSLYDCKSQSDNNLSEKLPSTEVILPAVKEKSECIFWAEQGECTKNKKYMVKYCTNACANQAGKVKKDGGSCFDSHPNCMHWAQNKQCETNPSYMLLYCSKSCKVCKLKRKMGESFRLRKMDSILQNEIFNSIHFTRELIKDKDILKTIN